ncbi:hypothetical protein GCM10009535_51540 [Streptomyces thermocarboxydovorans]|uniref:Lipoprotein n=1 Tax=Streptomyces thermocarboxydovorans TaxID=59298 RepID=A0ABP3T1A7_9ACTN
MTPSRSTALAALLLCTLPLTACTSAKEGPSYPVPDNICGIPADKEILRLLLHDGDELEQDTGHSTLEEGQICHMYVDGNEAVLSDAHWRKSGYTLRDYFEFSDRKGIRYFGGGKYASWNFGVVTVIPCPGVSEKGDAVSVAVNDLRWNEKTQPLLEKLGPPYFEAYKKKLGCPS